MSRSARARARSLGIASALMSLGRAEDKREGESEGRHRERGQGSVPGWRGELFSFYKLVQFFLKKRVNTTRTGCIYAESRDSGTRERKRGKRRGRVEGREGVRHGLLIASSRPVSSIPLRIRLTLSQQRRCLLEKHSSFIFLVENKLLKVLMLLRF